MITLAGNAKPEQRSVVTKSSPLLILPRDREFECYDLDFVNEHQTQVSMLDPEAYHSGLSVGVAVL